MYLTIHLCFHMCCSDVQLLPEDDQNGWKHARFVTNLVLKNIILTEMHLLILMCEVFMITSLLDKLFELKICCFEKYSCGMGRATICCAAAEVIHLSYRHWITKSQSRQYRAVVIRYFFFVVVGNEWLYALSVPGIQFPHHTVDATVETRATWNTRPMICTPLYIVSFTLDVSEML
jgi:hypothetical protein